MTNKPITLDTPWDDPDAVLDDGEVSQTIVAFYKIACALNLMSEAFIPESNGEKVV